MVNWLRTNVYAAGILGLIRLYLGWQWMNDGWGKLTGPKPFDATGFMQGIIAKPVVGPHKDVLYPMYNSFIEGFALPNVKLFNVLVAWGEFLVGVGLILGVLTTVAMFFGLMMNFMYLFAGTVSVNPWMILLGVLILFAGYNAGRFGGDYWVIPWVRQFTAPFFGKLTGKQNQNGIDIKHKVA
ncbi:DoxX family protein [Brevibacillus ginsengisoli]|uniref:DoxX family protein n=1 Tax=Brevibacillus ginsengisoli TaxID=363854 RepID=UPI003CF1BAE6